MDNKSKDTLKEVNSPIENALTVQNRLLGDLAAHVDDLSAVLSPVKAPQPKEEKNGVAAPSGSSQVCTTINAHNEQIISMIEYVSSLKEDVEL